MSIYKQAGCARWYVRLRVAGRLIRKATGTADRKEAEAVEAALKVALRARQGRAMLASMAEELFPASAPKVLLSRLWEHYEDAARAQGYKVGAETERKRRSACLRLTAWAKGVGVKTVEAVTVEVAAEFLAAVGGTAKTKRNVAGELSSVWRVLGARGVVEGNPWKVARPLPDKGEERHGRALTDEELEAVRLVCETYPNGGEWWDMATVALYTGLRLTDVRRLEGRMVDWGEGVLALTPAKTARHGIAVRIPLHPKVAEVFRRRGRDGGVLFPVALAEKWGRPHFSSILKKAGVVAQPGEQLTFHCLRHTFATRLATAGVPEDVRMQLCGWTEKGTARRYNHDETRARTAVLNLA